MAFEFAMDVEKPGPRTHGQLKRRRVDFNLVHEPQINQYPPSGGHGSPIAPGSSAPDGYRDFMVSGKGKDLEQVFFSGGLEDDIRQALQHEVPDHGRKIDIQVIAVVFEFLRIIDHPQTGIPAQERFERFHPG